MEQVSEGAIVDGHAFFCCSQHCSHRMHVPNLEIVNLGYIENSAVYGK